MVIFDAGMCIVVVYGDHASKNVVLLIKFSFFRHLPIFAIFGVKLKIYEGKSKITLTFAVASIYVDKF